MDTTHVLHIIGDLLRAADHPDYSNVTRYGRDTHPGGQSPSGIKATHLSGSTSMLWAAVEPRDAKPVDADEAIMTSMPGRTLRLVQRLLDAAQPAEFASWTLCAAPGVGWPNHGASPSALRITARDGSVAYLRATAASGPRGGTAEPKQDPCPDYQIPQEVVQWRHSPNAAHAEPVSV